MTGCLVVLMKHDGDRFYRFATLSRSGSHMQKFFQPSESVQVSQPHRLAFTRAIREIALSAQQKAALARYDAAAVAPEPFALRSSDTKPAAPAARRFQGWRVP